MRRVTGDGKRKTKRLKLAVFLLALVAVAQTAYIFSREPEKRDHRPMFGEILLDDSGAKEPDPFFFDPSLEMQQMQNRMNRMFNEMVSRMEKGNEGFSGSFTPEMDVKEYEDRYEIIMDLPGSEESSITVTVEGRKVTVSGRREVTREESDGDMIREERRAGGFSRTFTLPGPVKSDRAESKYDNGVLTVTIPRA